MLHSNQDDAKPSSNHLTEASTINQHNEHRALNLLSYAFWLPLVMSYLHDHDVIARLLIANKTIRHMISKYEVSHIVKPQRARAIIRASRDITFTVSRVQADTSANSTTALTDVLQENMTPLHELSYKYNLSSCDEPVTFPITHMSFVDDVLYCDLIVPNGWLPNTITNLRAESYVTFEAGSIPSSVRTLAWATHFDNMTDAIIPVTVTDLSLALVSLSPNDMISAFPTSLRRLDLTGWKSGFDVGVLPSSLTALRCEATLLCELAVGAIPSSVTSLYVHWQDMRVPRDGVVPESVTHLKIAVYEWTAVRWQLPSQVKHLSWYKTSGLTMSAWMVPRSVTHIVCTGEIDRDALPVGVTHVEWHLRETVVTCEALPSSVTHLKLISIVHPVAVLSEIPPSVTHFHFLSHKPQQMVQPIRSQSITHLTFDDSFNQHIPDDAIPGTVTHLVMGWCYNKPITCHTLPRHLTHLAFSDQFNQPIDIGVLPVTLTHLVFGKNFNQPIGAGVIPHSVTQLSFGDKFMCDLDEHNLPSSLTHLEIPRGYVKLNDKLWLPASVTHVAYRTTPLKSRPEFYHNFWDVCATVSIMSQ
jgi:hypothetical protein